MSCVMPCRVCRAVDKSVSCASDHVERVEVVEAEVLEHLVGVLDLHLPPREVLLGDEAGRDVLHAPSAESSHGVACVAARGGWLLGDGGDSVSNVIPSTE